MDFMNAQRFIGNNFLRKTCFTLFACSLLAVTGCKTRFVDFTIISTKNVDLSKMGTFKRGARTEGVDKIYIIIFIPTGQPNLKEAIDRAIESVPGGVALLDGVVSQGFFYIPYIYGEANFTVEGTVLIDPSLSGHAKAATGEPAYYVATLDHSGKAVSCRQVSPEEFQTIKHKTETAAPRTS